MASDIGKADWETGSDADGSEDVSVTGGAGIVRDAPQLMQV